MMDARLNRWWRPPLQHVAAGLKRLGLTADHLTWLGFIVGMGALPLIASARFDLAILAIVLNRLLDGLDGALARLGTPTDRGAFLDISLDFLFYASIPLAFALNNPIHNALAAAVLLFTFVGTGTSFLAFAVLAGQRGLSSDRFPGKGFYYLGGLTEGAETIGVFVWMCLAPGRFPTLAFGFAVLCLLTVLTRLAAGLRAFR